MQISIKITLDKRKKRKNGAYPLVIRLTKDRIPVYIPTGYAVHKEYFVEVDEQSGIVLKNEYIKNPGRVNQELKELMEDITGFLNKLKDEGVLHRLRSTDIKQEFLNRNKKATITLNAFMHEKEKQLRKSNRHGYADLWKYAESFLMRALKKEITFDEFSLKTILKLEMHHLSLNPDGINGLSAYLRLIRTAYYDYAKENNIEIYNNPWNKYTIRKKRTRKRATSGDIIKMFRDYKTVPGTMKHDAQQFYMLSFYLAGINLIDLARLKVKQIYDGKIHYTRTKVDEELTIPVPPQAQAILDEYLKGKGPDDYVLPIFEKNKNAGDNLKIYKSRRSTYNKHINEIFKAIGVVSDKRITFYSARHSWATRANELNKPITAISQGLGHTSIKTTQIYLEELQDNVLDDINRDIIDLG